MKKEIHPQSHKVHFVCTSCNNEYFFQSTIKNDKVSIDVCEKCHPFYLGNLSSQKARGRSEKLANKFETGKTQMNSTNKSEKKEQKSKGKKILTSLDSL